MAWLWKLCDEEIARVAEKGVWSKRRLRDFAAEEDEFVFDRWLYGAAMGYDSAAPDKPRALPLLFVSLLLGGLLLIAGPGDWFILGWLRRRRWTWITFPLLCVAATWLAAFLSKHYLGQLDRHGVVRITDVGANDQILREVRYDLLLPARDGQWSTDIRDGVVVKALQTFDPNMLADSAVSESRRGISFRDDGAAEGQWNAPGVFTFRRSVRQWSPVMNQSVRFPGTPDDSGIDWQKVSAAWKGAAALQTQTLPNYDTDGWHVMFGSIDAKTGPADAEIDVNADPNFDAQVRPASRVRVHGEIAIGSRMDYSVARGLMDARHISAFDAYVTAHSPVLDGAGITHAGMPGPLVVMVWRETEHEIHIYRRYFAEKDLGGVK